MNYTQMNGPWDQSQHAQRDSLTHYNQQLRHYNQQRPPTVAEIEQQIESMKAAILAKEAELHEMKMKTALCGPTPADLDQHPALKEAWENMEVIRKLTGVK